MKKFGAVLGESDDQSDSLILINSFDGAQHGVTEKKLLNITSYSSSLVSQASVKIGFMPASTGSILTWKQVVGEENMSTVVPAVSDMYKWYGENVEVDYANILGRKVHIYECHKSILTTQL